MLAHEENRRRYLLNKAKRAEKAKRKAAVEEQVRLRIQARKPKKLRGRPAFNLKHLRTAAFSLRMSENLRTFYDKEAAREKLPLSEYLYRVLLEHRKRVRHQRHRVRTARKQGA